MSILLFLLILTVSLGAVFGQDNSTSHDPLQTADGSFDEIDEKINNASSGDTISLEGEYSYSDNIITVNKDVTIDGNNKTTLNGGSNPIMQIYCDNVVLKNLKLINSRGSAISGYGNNILIENCEFINNEPSEFNNGGALQFSANNLTIKDCMFENNKNPVFVTGNNISIINSTFISNSENAVELYGLNELISDCKFISNDGAVYYGGHSQYYNVELKYDGHERFIVRNSLFSGNYGKGALAYEFIKEVSQSKINVNEALIDNCTFTDNTADDRGAAIYFDAQNSYASLSRMTVKDSRFEKNRISENAYTLNCGGAIFAKGDDGRVIGCNFTDNSAGENGGAIFASGDNFTVDSSRFVNCRAYDGIYYSDLGGGAVFYRGLDIHLSNSIFEGSNGCKGGAILAELSYTENKLGLFSAYNCSFTRNTAKCYAAICCADRGYAEIDSCEFKDNTAQICSAVYVLGEAEIRNSRFINNTSPFSTIVILEKYTLKNNAYSGNSPGVFILGKQYQGKAYDENLKKMELIRFTMTNAKIEYNSNRQLTVKLTHIYTGQPIPYAYLEIYSNGKKIAYGSTNAKGILSFGKSLKAGTYKVKVVLKSNVFVESDVLSFCHDYCPEPLTAGITVEKAKTQVSAPKIKAKYRQSKNFKITVKHAKKPVKKITLKVKIDKKTYKLKTSSKGIAKISTKNLKVGKHRVVISSGNANYQISAKSKITIR